jgi:hypothetical protein
MLCLKACIPCGFETQSPLFEPVKDAPQRKLNDVTVRQVLDILTNGPLKDYAWRVDKGVLEMMPKGVMDKKRSTVLNKRVPSVDIDGLDVQDSVTRICEQAGIAEGPVGRALQTASWPDYGRVSVHLKDVSVREALNAVVRADGKSGWHLGKDASEPRRISAWTCRPGIPFKMGR